MSTITLNKKTFIAALFAAVAVGAVVGHVKIDFEPVPDFDRPLLPANDEWRKDPLVKAQDVFMDDVAAFANGIKNSMPSRSEALQQHRNIDMYCKNFVKGEYLSMYSPDKFYNDSQRQAYNCVKMAEDIAVATHTKYDASFAERAAAYAETTRPTADNMPPRLK